MVPDQIIDRTKGIRPFTFFEGGMVGHVGFGDPFDEGLAKIVRKCGHSLEGDGVTLHDRGVIICMGEFPRYNRPWQVGLCKISASIIFLVNKTL